MRRGSILAGVLALALLAGGCGGEPDGPITVTLLTHDSFDVSASLLRAFEREEGIRVRLLAAGDAGQLVNRAILSAGNPEGDVLFGVDNHLLAAALRHDLFVPYEPRRLAAVDDTLELDPGHRVVPIDHGEVCVNADLARFGSPGSPPLPRTLDDLTDPLYRDQLVVENPATSTPGLAFLLATIARFGDPGWEAYWSDLRTNGVLVVDGWENAYFGEFSGAGGGEGSRPLVVSYATSPVAEVALAEDPPDDAPTGVLEETCFRQIELAGILRGTEHEEEARRLIDFLLSRPFQEDIPLRMFVYPVVDDARLPDVFREHAVVVRDPLELSAETIERGRAEWVERWTDLVLR